MRLSLCNSTCLKSDRYFNPVRSLFLSVTRQADLRKVCLRWSRRVVPLVFQCVNHSQNAGHALDAVLAQPAIM